MFDITVFTPEDAGIASVAAIKSELMAAVEKATASSTIILDISKTKKADSSLAQLIVSFRTEVAMKGLKAAIRGDTEERSMKAMLCCDFLDEPSGLKPQNPVKTAGGAS